MEVPHLNRLYEKYKEQGLIVLGINDEKDHSEVREYVENNINYPILIDADNQFDEYMIQGIPCTYYIDKEGRIRKREVGFGEGSEVAMEKLIVDLIK